MRKTVLLVGALSLGCSPAPQGSASTLATTAFVGASVIDGTSAAPVRDATILVQAGRITAIGPSAAIQVPANATVVDLQDRWVTPGLVNSHAHVGGTLGLEGGHYTEENLLRQLGLYARYGVTTVVSLGGDGAEGVALRDAEDAGLDRARLRIAGAVVTGSTADEATAQVASNVALGADFIKIRVDDNLGSGKKMSEEVYTAVIEAAHAASKPLAAHMFYLQDAKHLLRAGADFLAHSVRDQPVDDELLALFSETGVCLSPTLAREVSTFVYESEPDFFSDFFFLREADPAVLETLLEPERQQLMANSPAAQSYKQALTMAQANLKTLVDAGVPIAFGTDTGPPARFQGYFEHMELSLMAQAGLTPQQILRAATGDAAACLGLGDVGTLEPGKWADLLVLPADPGTDIVHLRTLESVWIAGNRVPTSY